MAPISTGRSLLFRRPFLNFASHFHPFPHRLLGRDGSRFPRLSSATHLALFKQFHPQNMCSSYNMGARRGPCVGSGAPRGWDMASLHPSAPQRVLLGEPADVTRTCVTMEWFVKPETLSSWAAVRLVELAGNSRRRRPRCIGPGGPILTSLLHSAF